MDNIKILDSISKDKKVFYDELGKVIIGQTEIVEHIFIAILCKGHILLEGVPGLGKTLIIKTISDIMDLNFNREKYFNSAFKNSFKILMNKILLSRDLKKVNDVKLKEIKNLINSFQILEESYRKKKIHSAY